MSDIRAGDEMKDDDDAPKLTEKWAEGADVYRGEKLIRKGKRPPISTLTPPQSRR